MIEESLLKSNYLGKDGFIWWLGQVAPPDVWDTQEKVSIDYQNNIKAWAYRCKVRIIGYHTFDRNILSDNDLPWAHILLSATDGNSQGGLGKTHKIIGGETVFGFFLDGDDAQQPVIVGTLHRNANVQNFDVDEVAYKPFSGAKYGRVKQGATKNTQSNVTQSSPSTSSGVENIIGGPMKAPSGIGVTFQNGSDKFCPVDKALQKAYSGPSKVKIVSENGCDNNVIGKITRAIQDFIATVNGIQAYIDTYVDPVLNTFVDITNEIKRTARTIVGAVKFLVNNMRNMISKMIGCLFSQFVGLVVPIPQQPVVGESAKNILNIIFCLFEKVIDKLLPFLEDMLQGLVGRALNAPLCAIEEFTATILNKLIDLIDEILEPILSGISWLVGGISQITSILTKATSIATEIFNLIGCDNLKCKTPSEWALNIGPSQSEYDNWNRVVKKMNVVRGFNNNLDAAVNSLSIYGGGGSPIFRDCSDRVNNPKSQKDLVNGGSGVKSPSCIPPEIEIYGDGVGASAIAVVGSNGSILSIQILNQGFGYSTAPTINIIDKSNYGFGAKAEAIISGGKVTQIYVTSSGFGYCKTDLSNAYKTPYYIVTADRYTLFEGETCNFTVTSENVTDGTIVSYYIGGDVTASDINVSLEGTLTIFNNTARISIGLNQDSLSEQIEELIFNLVDPDGNLVARTIILINDSISPLLSPTTDDLVQSPPGKTLPIGIGTQIPVVGGISTFFQPVVNIGIGTISVGVVTSIVISNPGLGYTNGDTITVGLTTEKLYIVPNENGSVISIGTTPTTVGFGTTSIFTPEITTSGGTGVTTTTTITSGITTTITNSSGVTTTITSSPGITTTTPGVTTTSLDVSGITTISTVPTTVSTGTTTQIGFSTTGERLPDTGTSPNPVISITNILPALEYSSIPDLIIDSNTGEGAVLYPVISYIPKVTSPPVIAINDKGVLKIVDCI